MSDIIDRLEEACKGYPAAWPHRLLHDAISEIERLRGVAQAPTESREKEITRLATIEECARLAENTGLRNPENIARDIRALAPSPADQESAT